MKWLTFLWCIVIFICTCTRDQSALIHHLNIYFQYSNPYFADLLRTDDIYYYSTSWYFYKAGHFTLFAILSLLALHSFKHRKTALFFSISIALATEILQLFFSRDGRLYDVVIDSSGAVMSYLLLRFWRRKRTWKQA